MNTEQPKLASASSGGATAANGVITHGKLHPRCLHQLHGGELARRESENLPNLVPVTIPDRGVLKLSNGSQTRDHVLHRCVETLISVPGTHRLVKAANVLTGKWI